MPGPGLKELEVFYCVMVTWGGAGRPGCPLPRRGHRTTGAPCGLHPVQPWGHGRSWDENPGEWGVRGSGPPRGPRAALQRGVGPGLVPVAAFLSALSSRSLRGGSSRWDPRADFERRALGTPRRQTRDTNLVSSRSEVKNYSTWNSWAVQPRPPYQAKGSTAFRGWPGPSRRLGASWTWLQPAPSPWDQVGPRPLGSLRKEFVLWGLRVPQPPLLKLFCPSCPCPPRAGALVAPGHRAPQRGAQGLGRSGPGAPWRGSQKPRFCSLLGAEHWPRPRHTVEGV